MSEVNATHTKNTEKACWRDERRGEYEKLATYAVKRDVGWLFVSILCSKPKRFP